MIGWKIFCEGLATGAGLIMAIGAQNAFVLTRAVEREHAVAVAATCAGLDALLIFAGVAGLGALVAENAILRGVASWGGAAFLFWFAARSFRAAFKAQGLQAAGDAGEKSLGATLAATLAISLLNPHVYLDTVVMLGSISGSHPGAGRWIFGAGAAVMSVIWFFALCFAGRRLEGFFRSPRAWTILYVLVGLMVSWVGVSLVMGAI